MKTLIISDGKPGHLSQAKALCDIMDWQGIEAVAKYPSRAAKGLSYALDWLGINTASAFILEIEGKKYDANFLNKLQEEFDLIVAVGSASYYPAKVIRKKTSLRLIAMMYPRGFKLNFDLIICPYYDNPPVRDNIKTLPITLCCKNDAFYGEMTKDFQTKFDCKLPAVSVIIGGDNKYEKICPKTIQTQLEQIFELTPSHYHWVTTSRRTSSEVESIVDKFPFDYKLIYSRRQYNPIPAFLSLSDYIFVTSDSSSMLSECVSVGKAKIEVLKNISKKKNKFDIFLDKLHSENTIHLFDGTLGNADKKIPIKEDIQIILSNFTKSGKNSL